MEMLAGSPYFALITSMSWVMRVLAGQLAERGVGKDPLPARLVAPAYAWLGRTLQRFVRLVERFEAGRLVAGEASVRRPGAERSAAAPSLFHLRLPRGRGWLLKLLPGQAGHAHQNLARLLEEPEMQALIAGAPAIGRLLRPLARMLDVPLPASLELPARPKLAPCPRAPVPDSARTRQPQPGLGGQGETPGRPRLVSPQRRVVAPG